MPKLGKKQIIKKVESRGQQRVKSTQTDISLLECLVISLLILNYAN